MITDMVHCERVSQSLWTSIPRQADALQTAIAPARWSRPHPGTGCKMHAACGRRKKAATESGQGWRHRQAVHEATIRSIESSGFRMGLPTAESPAISLNDPWYRPWAGTRSSRTTLLDRGGPRLGGWRCDHHRTGALLPTLGGVRVEDMVVVTEQGCTNLNRLPETPGVGLIADLCST